MTVYTHTESMCMNTEETCMNNEGIYMVTKCTCTNTCKQCVIQEVVCYLGLLNVIILYFNHQFLIPKSPVLPISNIL